MNNFIVEPFLPHPSHTKYYVCINSAREGDYILFTHHGGVDIGDIDAKALKLDILIDVPFPSRDVMAKALLLHVPAETKEILVDFLVRLYRLYVDLHFAYLKINPPAPSASMSLMRRAYDSIFGYDHQIGSDCRVDLWVSMGCC